ncbi:MAG: DedA family protein [Myxococcales bacterium]|nr:DedA family protein [Myxococcales bacterium]
MHELLVAWFEFTREWGYLGVFLMMALESTIVPVPSEIVIPPAAYWASQGELSMTGVVLAGGAGSTFGSSATYVFTATFGRAFVARWGRYFLLPVARLEMAERWLETYQTGGVFIARLLPVVRHLIGFPAGLVRMPFATFAAVTFVGSTLWCAVLAFFGAKTIGAKPDLLQNPGALAEVLKHDLWWFVAAVVGLGAGWLFVKWFAGRNTVAA